MNYISLTIFFVGFLLIVIFSLKKFLPKKNQTSNYKLKTFLTNNEKDCFIHLSKEFPEFIIAPQVCMGAILDPILNIYSKNPQERSQSAILRNKISSKIIDFVLIDKKTLNPVFIIELDDKSHDTKKQEDFERDQQLLLAGIKTVRFRRSNNTFLKRQQILDLIA